MSAPTHKQLAANQRRSLRAIRDKLMRMAADWDGVDQFNMNALAELADKAKEIAAELVPDGSGND